MGWSSRRSGAADAKLLQTQSVARTVQANGKPECAPAVQELQRYRFSLALTLTSNQTLLPSLLSITFLYYFCIVLFIIAIVIITVVIITIILISSSLLLWSFSLSFHHYLFITIIIL